MSITTLSGVISKLQFPRDFVMSNGGSAGWLTSWGGAVFPVGGSYNNTLNGVVLDSTSAQVAGQIYFPSPNANAYLSKIEMQTNQGGLFLMLADKLWHNGNISATSTSAQLITTPTWPARDINGATTGEGLCIGVEISGTMGAATPTITVSYTNTASVAGRTATNIRTTGSGDVIGRFYDFALQAGDTGVKSIESITLGTSWVSGTMNLVVYRPLIHLPILNPTTTPYMVDAVGGGFPRLFTGSVPYFISNCASAASYYGKLLFSDG